MGHINLPKDSNGWSVFTPSADSRIVYISETGDDSTGQIYDKYSFVDPMEPVAELAFATYQGALTGVRDGYPDWILFKRGESFVDFIPLGDTKSGRSETEPFLISSYGGVGDLPILKHGVNYGIDMRRGASYSVYADLDFYAHTADPDGLDFITYGGGQALIAITGAGYAITGLLIEGCKFRFTAGLALQKYLGTTIDSITLRRNYIYKSYSVIGHASGLWLQETDGVVLEENIFYHNGWLIQNRTGDMDDKSDGQATFFNHNMYLSLITNTIIRNNLIIEGAGAGLKVTSSSVNGVTSLEVYDNFFLGGTIGCNIGNNYDSVTGRFAGVSIRDNVFTHIGWSRPTLEATAWYSYLDGWSSGEYKNNILIRQNNALNTNTKGVYFQSTIQNTEISGNVVWGLDDGVGLALEWDEGGNPDGPLNVSISNNIIKMPLTYSYLVDLRYDIDGLIDNGSNIYHTEDGTDLFRYQLSDMNFDTWVSNTGDTSIIKDQVLVDTSRSVETYQQSIGGLGTIEDFISSITSQSRYNWDLDYEAKAVNSWFQGGFVKLLPTYKAPNKFNGSNNKYKYPVQQELIDADATQNLDGLSPYMYLAGVPVAKSEAELLSDGVMNGNQQMYGCLNSDGIWQYSNQLTANQDAEVKDSSSCWDVEYLVDANGDKLVDVNGDYLTTITEN